MAGAEDWSYIDDIKGRLIGGGEEMVWLGRRIGATTTSKSSEMIRLGFKKLKSLTKSGSTVSAKTAIYE